MEKDKKVIIVGAILIILVIIFTFFRSMIDRRNDLSQKIDSGPGNTEQYSFISANELEKQLDQVVIFDCRNQNEFRAEHIPGSFNVDQDFINQYLQKAASHQKIVIVGANSSDFSVNILAKDLKEKGMENFSILSGGFASWIESMGRTVRQGNLNSLADQAKINIIKPEDLKSALDNKNSKIYILDLRPSSQYVSGHLPQAKNIFKDQLEEKSKSIPLGKSIIYYAESELETFQSGVTLFDLGFHGASALEGGFEEWKTKGFPIEK